MRFLPKSLVTLLVYEIILLTYYLGTTEILLGDYKLGAGHGGVVVSFSAFYAGGRGFDSHNHQS